MRSNAKLRLVGIVLCFVFCLLLGEVVLTLIYPFSTQYYLWQPTLQTEFYPDTDVLPGVYGVNKFSINRNGFRGDEFSAQGRNFLCIGGSTTECLYLDDTETWPYQLQGLLRNVSGYELATVNNAGKSAHTSRKHYLAAKYVLPQIQNLEAVILMVGFNDLMYRLASDTLYESEFVFSPTLEDSLVRQAFIITGSGHGSNWWRRTAWFCAIRAAYYRLKDSAYSNENLKNVQDNRGLVYKAWRLNRSNASKWIDSLPDLTSALNEFERNLNAIYRQTRERGVKLILVNQTALYHDSMDAYHKSLLWMGGQGSYETHPGRPYYTPEVLDSALRLYNQALQRFALSNSGVLHIDITSLPRDTSIFYDDCHFNEKGAKMVAETISKEIVAFDSASFTAIK